MGLKLYKKKRDEGEKELLRFQSFLSSSSGNCTFLTDGDAKILVDCGANGKYITECLNRIDINPEELDAILISHSHRDHVSGAGVMSRRFDIPVFASEETWDDMSSLIGKVSTMNTKIIEKDEKISIADISIKSFSIPHDAKGSVAFRFETENTSMSIATDIGHISDELFDNLSGCEFIIIEANHDLQMLRNGSYPYYLKRRILSDAGHLSNDDCGKLCTMLAKSGTKAFWLGHLSGENNTPDLAYNTVKKTLYDSGIDVGNEISLNVLPKFWLTD